MAQFVTSLAHMRAQPPGKGARVLLCLHGWAMTGQVFADLASRLGPEWIVCAPTFPGHGDLQHVQSPQGDWSIEGLADWLSDQVEQADLHEMVILGWSMGASVAWRALATRLGSRVLGLVSIDMTPLVGEAQGWDGGIRGGSNAERASHTAASMVRNWPLFVREMVNNVPAFGPPEPPRALISYLAEQALQADPRAMADLWRALVAFDARELVAKLDVPTLIVAGARSRLYGPATTQFLERVMPDARSAIIAHAGHAPHLEDPDAFVRALTRFLVSTKVTRSSGALEASRPFQEERPEDRGEMP